MTTYPPLVLIPGLFCNEQLFQAQIQALQPANVIVANITPYDSIDASTDALLTQLPEKFCLAGFSLGGLNAMRIMEKAPERVAKLALMSCTNGSLMPAAGQRLQAWVERLTDERRLEEFLTQHYPYYFHQVENEKFKNLYFNMARAVGVSAGVKQMHALLNQTSSFAHLSDIQCPTIVVGGSEDHRIGNEMFHQLANAIPQAKLFLIKNCGHFTPIEQPEALNRLLLDWYQKRT